MNNPTNEQEKPKVKRAKNKSVEVRQRKVLCCLMAGLTPEKIMNKYVITRSQFYYDVDVLKKQGYLNTYDKWEAKDISRHGLKTKAHILLAIGYNKVEIAQMFDCQRDTITRLLKFKNDRGMNCLSPILIETLDHIKSDGGTIAKPGLYNLEMWFDSPNDKLAIWSTHDPSDLSLSYIIKPEQLLYNHKIIDAIFIDGVYLGEPEEKAEKQNEQKTEEKAQTQTQEGGK
jgi:hypothetical protein